jgi:hypothetical protein
MGKKKVSRSDSSAASRVVLDTSVSISAILFHGRPSRLVGLWQKGRLHVLMSSDVLNEYVRVLAYPKFRLAKEDIKSIIEQELIPFVEPVKTSAVFRIIVEDPSDDKFLVLAVDGQADHIISGDKHLLGLKEFRGIKIVTAEEFLSLNMIVLGSGIKTGR